MRGLILSLATVFVGFSTTAANATIFWDNLNSLTHGRQAETIYNGVNSKSGIACQMKLSYLTVQGQPFVDVAVTQGERVISLRFAGEGIPSAYLQGVSWHGYDSLSSREARISISPIDQGAPKRVSAWGEHGWIQCDFNAN